MAECLSDGALSHLSPPDRARAQRLTLDTLRKLAPMPTGCSKPHLKKRPAAGGAEHPAPGHP